MALTKKDKKNFKKATLAILLALAGYNVFRLAFLALEGTLKGIGVSSEPGIHLSMLLVILGILVLLYGRDLKDAFFAILKR